VKKNSFGSDRKIFTPSQIWHWNIFSIAAMKKKPKVIRQLFLLHLQFVENCFFIDFFLRVSNQWTLIKIVIGFQLLTQVQYQKLILLCRQTSLYAIHYKDPNIDSHKINSQIKKLQENCKLEDMFQYHTIVHFTEVSL
jgi:hypothetical protein